MSAWENVKVAVIEVQQAGNLYKSALVQGIIIYILDYMPLFYATRLKINMKDSERG